MLKYDLHSLNLVDRNQYIAKLCSGRRVLHLGATDAPYTQVSIRTGAFLHKDLQEVAYELVGLDLNKNMIDWLENNYGISNIRFGDIEEAADYPEGSFDVIVAGDIFEHLNNPGKCLSALRKRFSSDVSLIVTVPNAYSLKRFIRVVFGYELIHPDHVLHHSPYTLKSLVERYSFHVEENFSFTSGGSGVIAALANKAIAFRPQLAEGIGVVCMLKPLVI